MASIDSEQVKALTHKSNNAEIRKRWMASDPIEMRQSQCVHPANADVPSISPASLK